MSMPRADRWKQRLGRALVWIAGGSVLAFLVAPVIAVIPMSFSSSEIIELIPTSPSLVQYRRFFSSEEWMLALWRSIQVASGTMVVACVLGVCAALALWRLPPAVRNLIEGFLILPRIVPSIVFAVGIYGVFLQYGIVGSVWSLILAHVVIATPFVVIMVGSALRGVDPALDEASRSLGAGPASTFFRIILPQIRLAILGGGLFAFNISFDEVVITLFLSGVRNKTLPVKVWDAIQFEITPILPAISATVILATILVLVPALLLRRSPR